MPPPSKSWQARISEAADVLSQSFVESISYDWRLYRHDIAGSLAHAAMLAGAGLISPDDLAAIRRGFADIAAEIDRDGPRWPGFKPALEDLHMCLETELTARIGEPARRLHTGRSRNDQVALDLLLWLHDAAAETAGDLRDLCAAFVALAERSIDVVLPSYTHLQRAQPISAAADCLAWATMFDRDRDRLTRLLPPRPSPLGSGAIAGSSLPLDPAVTAAALAPAVSGPPVSSIFHTSSRDEACDYVYALAMASQHLSRFAETWIIQLSTEYSFLRIADRHTTSSSMMPQKRNPDLLELIRGRCATVYGDLLALLTLLKGLPSGYNRDLQEDKRILFRAHDTTRASLVMAAAIVSAADYLPANIDPTLDRGFLDATSLAEHLVTAGVPFRTAHHVVGSLVRHCEQTGRHRLSDLSLDEINTALADAGSPLRVDATVQAALGARNVVARYRTTGAAGGPPLAEALAAWTRRLTP